VSQSNIDVSVETAQGLERRLTVTLPGAAISSEVDARLKKVGRTARLKGFRPGKVPAKVVRQRYGGQVRQEVLSDLIRSSFAEAIRQQQLNPAGGPSIEPLSGDSDENFRYRAVFEIYPEVAVGPIEKLRFEVPEVDITDKDVDAMIGKLREQRAEWQTVDRKSADGDRVVIDFEGTIDGEPFEGGKGEKVALVVGSGQVIDDFDKGIRGLTAGDDKTIKVKFPKDYGVADLAGKKAEFAVQVAGVEAQVLPEVDDEFMSSFGVTEGGMDAFRADIRKNMERELSDRLRATMRNNALDALHDANPFDVPRALIAQEVQALQQETMQRMGTDDPSRVPGADVFRPVAEKRVRLSLLVQKLISESKIEVDRDRVDARIEELSSPYEEPDQAAQLYRSNRQLMAQIESAVQEEQVVDYLVENATAKRKKLGFDEFMNQDDA